MSSWASWKVPSRSEMTRYWNKYSPQVPIIHWLPKYVDSLLVKVRKWVSMK